ncbi:hypothetical protein CYMTET_45922, partial [Cymbomonas tetramitiformis]
QPPSGDLTRRRREQQSTASLSGPYEALVSAVSSNLQKRLCSCRATLSPRKKHEEVVTSVDAHRRAFANALEEDDDELSKQVASKAPLQLAAPRLLPLHELLKQKAKTEMAVRLSSASESEGKDESESNNSSETSPKLRNKHPDRLEKDVQSRHDEGHSSKSGRWISEDEGESRCSRHDKRRLKERKHERDEERHKSSSRRSKHGKEDRHRTRDRSTDERESTRRRHRTNRRQSSSSPRARNSSPRRRARKRSSRERSPKKSSKISRRDVSPKQSKEEPTGTAIAANEIPDDIRAKVRMMLMKATD